MCSSYTCYRDTGLYHLQSRYYDPKIGRFLNADALVSTGQGVLGNNMFAYCCNDCVNYSDHTGYRREFWYVLFDEHDPGYIHRQVQAHILATYNLSAILFKKEFVMSGVGRADIYKPSTGEIWEIKHGGSSADMQAQRVREAHDQVKRYRDKYTEVSLQLGAAGAFAGAFTINYLNTTYLVTYDTPKEGVILYYLTRASDYDPNPFAIRKPALAPAGNNQQQMIGLVLTGFVYCAVGCAANNAKRHCFISN